VQGNLQSRSSTRVGAKRACRIRRPMPRVNAHRIVIRSELVVHQLTVDRASARVDRMSEAVATATPDRMTWDQICGRYEGEWVVLIDVDWIDDIDFEVRSAVVVAHGKSRRETLARVRQLPKPIEFAHFFIPKPGYRE
jgi:hypothetical protein